MKKRKKGLFIIILLIVIFSVLCLIIISQITDSVTQEGLGSGGIYRGLMVLIGLDNAYTATTGVANAYGLACINKKCVIVPVSQKDAACTSKKAGASCSCVPKPCPYGKCGSFYAGCGKTIQCGCPTTLPECVSGTCKAPLCKNKKDNGCAKLQPNSRCCPNNKCVSFDEPCCKSTADCPIVQECVTSLDCPDSKKCKKGFCVDCDGIGCNIISGGNGECLLTG